MEYFEEFKENAERFIFKAKVFFVEQYTKIIEYPVVSKMLSFGQACLEIAKDMLSSQFKNYNVRTLVEVLLARFNIYTSTIIKILDFVYNNENLLSYDFQFDPYVGYLVYSQVLPIHWVRYSEIPAFMNLFGPSGKPAAIDVNKFYFAMHDFFRELFTAISTKTVLPPFAGTGMIIGDNQIMTFDRVFYDFSGNCSYLLTKDFNSDRFSVIANYENEERKSIIINLENYQIKINKDGKVLLDNTMIDLPKILGDTYIKREGYKITLLTKKGLKVICNLVSNICIFKISGWYFGKTGGLLGVYDNEPSNDRMNSSGMIIENLKTFTESWQLSDSCSSNYTEIVNEETEWETQKCADYFERRTSLLVPCFDTVDPSPFKSLCLKQMEYYKTTTTKTKGFCQVASSYIELCKVISSRLSQHFHSQIISGKQCGNVDACRVLQL